MLGYAKTVRTNKEQGMLIYEYKLDGSKAQFAAIEEAIRTTQFIRNKCLRLSLDGCTRRLQE
uniref:Transposase n=1 Tax=Thermosporothrix sp. COM3 TaxID=2490863 RepID=A0A455SL69_9CHLR|nr:hypothetical protein KTC_05750 [Thermosporothrix sp. COM3]